MKEILAKKKPDFLNIRRKFFAQEPTIIESQSAGQIIHFIKEKKRREGLEPNRRKLWDYLNTGENLRSDCSRDVERVILTSTLKELLLKAGYTDLSLFGFLFGFITYLDKKSEDGTILFHISFNPNPYDIEPGQYEAISTLKYIVLHCEPDYPNPDDDPLRQDVLEQIRKFEEMQIKLKELIGPFAPYLLSYDPIEGVKFSLHPLTGDGQKKYKSGSYPLAEFEKLLNGDSNSSILQINHSNERSQRSFNYHDFVDGQLKLLSSDPKEARQFRALFLSCTLLNLVLEYENKYLDTIAQE
ncbi:MAG: hypothetical protein H6772_02835 [Pseudomonadales bacterium]|nr:hypothetical protein [Pseudomonadales bacterium]